MYYLFKIIFANFYKLENIEAYKDDYFSKKRLKLFNILVSTIKSNLRFIPGVIFKHFLMSNLRAKKNGAKNSLEDPLF